jgi:hypothetical protein
MDERSEMKRSRRDNDEKSSDRYKKNENDRIRLLKM